MQKTKELLRKITMESLVSAAEEWNISKEDLSIPIFDIESELELEEGLSDSISDIINTAVGTNGFSRCFNSNSYQGGFIIDFDYSLERELFIQIDHPKTMNDLFIQILKKIEKYKNDEEMFDNIYLYKKDVVCLSDVLGRKASEEEMDNFIKNFNLEESIEESILRFFKEKK